MSVFALARRGARVGICVLALGVAEAEAQQVPSDNTAATEGAASTSSEAAKESQGVTPAEPSKASEPPAPGTSTLPELVVDAPKDKKKVQKKAGPAATSAGAAPSAVSSEPPPPGVSLGSSAASDTGTTTFDASAVNVRTNGSGDANTFMRNLPNVQYQNMGSNNPGASSQTSIDTKPQLLSISGGRTYENNFIINGVSVTNIAGPTSPAALTDTGTSNAYTGSGIYGVSPQGIYVPSDFVGQATVIDSNASAEYGQFSGGVVVYDLVAPPTDRYHASVSASYDSSEFANYILATPDGLNTNKRLAPSYEKRNLSASVGAPITSDFAFIAQVSRKEAESSKQYHPVVSNGFGDESSDNVFMRFAATAKTDIGKFTFDTSRTDYYQHWFQYQGRDMYIDVDTVGTTTKLEHEVNVAGVRADEIGLGRAKLKSKVFYNTSETENNSGDNYLFRWRRQTLGGRDPATGIYTTNTFNDPILSGCDGIALGTYSGTTATTTVPCYSGGYGDTLQSQTDYGVQSILSGDLLLGNFKLGAELKRYEGRNARAEDTYDMNGIQYSSNINGTFVCNGIDYCSPYQYLRTYNLYPKHDTEAAVNAFHSFAEIDQTWKWFNVRAGVRYDYDDYAKNHNIAPRMVGTITPFDGLAFTGGYNRYYLGETLYYALRDKIPAYQTWSRGSAITSGTPAANFSQTTTSAPTTYTSEGLATPFDDEFSGAVRIRDPLLGGQVRLRYLERHGEDQFATESCGTNCYIATSNGEKFYRSATAEYTKEWNGLKTPFFLNAAAVTGNVTWSEQENSKNTYLLNSDLNGDGSGETYVWYKGKPYSTEEFSAVTGNLDIPVRFGATVATMWFDGLLELSATAGISLGFQGVYEAQQLYFPTPPDPHCPCNRYEDRKFGPSLKLDIAGQINVTEQAAIQFNVNNITNSTQNAITLADSPWVLGRSYWIGSALRF